MGDKARMIAQLPPVPCEPDLRERVVALAKSERRSIAYIQRQALEFFLAKFGSNATTNVSNQTIESEMKT